MQAIIHNGSSEVNPGPIFRNAAMSARGFVACEGLHVGRKNQGNGGACVKSLSLTVVSAKRTLEGKPDWVTHMGSGPIREA